MKLLLPALHLRLFANLLLAVVICETISCWRHPLSLKQIGCVLLVQSERR
jgi:hypothetical protein